MGAFGKYYIEGKYIENLKPEHGLEHPPCRDWGFRCEGPQA